MNTPIQLKKSMLLAALLVASVLSAPTLIRAQQANQVPAEIKAQIVRSILERSAPRSYLQFQDATWVSSENVELDGPLTVAGYCYRVLPPELIRAETADNASAVYLRFGQFEQREGYVFVKVSLVKDKYWCFSTEQVVLRERAYRVGQEGGRWVAEQVNGGAPEVFFAGKLPPAKLSLFGR